MKELILIGLFILAAVIIMFIIIWTILAYRDYKRYKKLMADMKDLQGLLNDLQRQLDAMSSSDWQEIQDRLARQVKSLNDSSC